MTRITFSKTENRVRVNRSETEEFETTEMIRQENPLSSMLLSVLLEEVIKGLG